MSRAISYEAWQAELARLEGNRERRPSGPGWVESGELRKRLGVGSVKFQRLMQAGKKAGTVDYFWGYVCKKPHGLVRCTWYRLKKSG